MLYCFKLLSTLPSVMSPSRHQLLDRLGAWGSLLCALHCALLPALLALLPSLGIALLAGDRIELGFVVFATGLGLFSLAWGYRRHGHVHALGILVPGLALLWGAVLYQPLHLSVWPHALAMTAGGTLVGLAHLANLRLHHPRSCPHHGCAH